MMMEGRGATSCLVCADAKKLYIFNNVGIISGIQLLYDTHKYNIMLMSSRICIECAGRLHQLFDFSLVMKGHNTNKDEAHCGLCADEPDLLPIEFSYEVKRAAGCTKWSKRCPEENARSCYSCYNYLILYARIRATLDQECLSFYSKIRSWQVVLPPRLLKEQTEKARQPNDLESKKKEILKGTQNEGSTFLKNFMSKFQTSPTRNKNVRTAKSVTSVTKRVEVTEEVDPQNVDYKQKKSKHSNQPPRQKSINEERKSPARKSSKTEPPKCLETFTSQALSRLSPQKEQSLKIPSLADSEFSKGGEEDTETVLMQGISENDELLLPVNDQGGKKNNYISPTKTKRRMETYQPTSSVNSEEKSTLAQKRRVCSPRKDHSLKIPSLADSDFSKGGEEDTETVLMQGISENNELLLPVNDQGGKKNNYISPTKTKRRMETYQPTSSVNSQKKATLAQKRRARSPRKVPITNNIEDKFSLIKKRRSKSRTFDNNQNSEKEGNVTLSDKEILQTLSLFSESINISTKKSAKETTELIKSVDGPHQECRTNVLTLDENTRKGQQSQDPNDNYMFTEETQSINLASSSTFGGISNCELSKEPNEDKFSSIKKRRAAVVPNVLTVANLTKTSLNLDQTFETTQHNFKLPSVSYERGNGTLSGASTPSIENSLHSETISLIGESLCENVSIVQEDTIKEIEELVVSTLEIPEQLHNFSESNFEFDEGNHAEVDILETAFPSQPSQVDEVMMIDSTPKRLSYEELCQLHKVKDFSISITRIDPEKLDIILRKRKYTFGRQPEKKKISKSGRVWKPKIIIDPSTEVTHYKSRNILKAKTKRTRKVLQKRAEKTKKLATKPKSDKNIIPNPNPKANVLELELPDEDLPHEIEEAFVDYSNGDVSTSSINNMDNAGSIVTNKSPRRERIEIEFISPLKHKGKVVIQGKLMPTVRAIC